MAYPEKGYYLDRKLTTSQVTAAVSEVSDGGDPPAIITVTTWTLPYALPTDGSEGVLAITNAFSGELYTSTRPSTTTIRVVGDLSGAEVLIGVIYPSRWRFSKFYPRGADGQADTGGRMQIRELKVEYTETTDFTATVEPEGRSEKEYVFDEEGLSEGEFRIPVLSRNTAVVEIVNETPGPSAFSAVSWEGTLDRRSRRI